MGKPRVLFVCVHNAARSQMAEALLRKWAGDRFEVESAGLEAGTLNPLAVAVMREVGIDISAHRTKDVFELYRQGRIYRFVITVCDEASAERCPLFPGVTERLHWSLADPATFVGSWEEQLAQTRLVRDQIEQKIWTWLNTLPPAE
jgi:arsenate reductase